MLGTANDDLLSRDSIVHYCPPSHIQVDFTPVMLLSNFSFLCQVRTRMNSSEQLLISEVQCMK